MCTIKISKTLVVPERTSQKTQLTPLLLPVLLCPLYSSVDWDPPSPPPRFDTEPSPASRWKQQQQEASQLTDPSPTAWKTRKKSRGEEYSNFGAARER